MGNKVVNDVSNSPIRNLNSALPEGWRWVKLGEVCDEAKTCDPRLSPNVSFRYIDIASINSASKRIIETRIILGKDAPSRARQLVEANDILVATTRPNLNAVAFVPAELDGEICSTGFCVLRPDAIVDATFLFFLVQARDFIDTLSGEVRGMLYPAVTNNQVRSINIPLPPLPEQKRIAAKVQELMAEVERARSACGKQLEAAKALPSAYLHQVFESEEAKKWDRRKLGEIIEDIQPGFACGKRAGDDGVIQLRMNNISSDGQVDLSSTLRVPAAPEQINQYQLLAGDIVFNNTNSVELVGKTALFHEVKGVFVYSNHLTRLRTKAGVLDSVYLTFWLQLQWYQRLFERICNRWIGQAAVKREKLLALELPLPALPEQKRIAADLQNRIASTGKLKASIEKQLATIKALPQAILRKAFSGEL